MAKQDKLQKLEAEAIMMERRALAVTGISLTPSQCQNLVAVVHGYVDWTDAQTRLAPQSPSPRQELDRQAKFAINVARQFLEAASRSRERRTDNERFSQAIIPAVVLAAFSVELVLKAIHIREMRKPIGGHDLGILMRSISSASMSAIEVLAPAPTYPAYDPPRTFLQCVDAAGAAFVEWRYIHESNKNLAVDLDFLTVLAEASLQVYEQLARS